MSTCIFHWCLHLESIQATASPQKLAHFMFKDLLRQKPDRNGIKSRQAEYKIRSIFIKRDESPCSLSWQVLDVIFNYKKTRPINQNTTQTPHRTKPLSNRYSTINPLNSEYQKSNQNSPHFYPAEALFHNFQLRHCTCKHFT